MTNISKIKPFTFGNIFKTKEEPSSVTSLLRKRTNSLISLISMSFSRSSSSFSLKTDDRNSSQEWVVVDHKRNSLDSITTTTSDSTNPWGEEDTALTANTNPFDDIAPVAVVKRVSVVAETISNKLGKLENEYKGIEKEFYAQLTDISRTRSYEKTSLPYQKGLQAFVKVGELKLQLVKLQKSLNSLETNGEGEEHLNKCMLELDVETLLPQMLEILKKGTLKN